MCKRIASRHGHWWAKAPWKTINVDVMPHSDCVILWSETNHWASVMLRSMAKLWGKALRATIYVGEMPHRDCEPFPLSCQFYKI